MFRRSIGVGSRPRAVTLYLVVACLAWLAAGGLTATELSAQRRQPDQRPRQIEWPAEKPTDPRQARGPQPPAVLTLAPGKQNVRVGSSVRLSLAVLGAKDVLRLPTTVRYDPEILRPIAVEVGPAWNRGPEPVLLRDASRPGELVIGIARLGSNAATINGTAELLRLTFRAVAAGRTDLRLERFALQGPGSSTQTVRARPATVTVQ